MKQTFCSSCSELLRSDASCVFIQGEAERAPSGEAEVGGEDYGSISSPRAQHATSSQQGQVLHTNIFTYTVHQTAKLHLYRPVF